MKYPYDLITQEDEDSIFRYIVEYGNVRPQVSIKDLLCSWSRNKGTLFKAFGRTLRIEQDIKLKPTYEQVCSMLHDIYKPTDDIYERNKGELITHITNLPTLTPVQVNDFLHMVSYKNIYQKVTDKDYIFDFEKQLKIPKGTKTMRAVRKFLLSIGYNRMDVFERWRNKISDVITKNYIESKLVLSIHPADFLSLSDNISGWSSCLSWREDGVGKCGCVEMMNNKYAIVAYLTNGKMFCGNIPNKTWRTLIYVNKYILLSGKAYPFSNDEVTKIALEKVRELVYNNLQWKYQYGLERYYDGYIPPVHRSKYLKGCLHFDFITMYDDINMNRDTTFYCYRNYSIDKKCKNGYNSYSRLFRSQKPTCLCCGKDMHPLMMDGLFTCVKCTQKEQMDTLWDALLFSDALDRIILEERNKRNDGKNCHPLSA